MHMDAASIEGLAPDMRVGGGQPLGLINAAYEGAPHLDLGAAPVGANGQSIFSEYHMAWLPNPATGYAGHEFDEFIDTTALFAGHPGAEVFYGSVPLAEDGYPEHPSLREMQWRYRMLSSGSLNAGQLNGFDLVSSQTEEQTAYRAFESIHAMFSIENSADRFGGLDRDERGIRRMSVNGEGMNLSDAVEVMAGEASEQLAAVGFNVKDFSFLTLKALIDKKGKVNISDEELQALGIGEGMFETTRSALAVLNQMPDAHLQSLCIVQSMSELGLEVDNMIFDDILDSTQLALGNCSLFKGHVNTGRGL